MCVPNFAVSVFEGVFGQKFLNFVFSLHGKHVPGEAVVSTEKLARGMTNDLILPVQYFVLDAILDVFCTRALLPIFHSEF
jgi:hypothetical protein